ncbi:tetratricopeptide repeat protein [Massilia suwonensis]|uniref:Tetratricopeptide repeat protein n=1 Tax=Massilia suwonensis TaxID=648895 RepID=A0ABW0MML5_9BURK
MPIWKRSVVLVLALLLQWPAHAAEPEYNLGVIAYRAQDYADARQHWEKSVAEGNIDAMNNLGFLLHTAQGGPRDQKRAVSLWTQAAKKGQSESQWHLAQASESGEGTDPDPVEAYAWYRCAIVSISVNVRDEDERETLAMAKNDLLRVLDQLPEEQVAAAEKRARRYIAAFALK